MTKEIIINIIFTIIIKRGTMIIKSKAFTLAEVLITLGIIGIISAITIPILINNYRKKVSRSVVGQALPDTIILILLQRKCVMQLNL